MFKWLWLLLPVMLSACGNGMKSEGGQVLARVNGKEITLQQYNDALQLLGEVAKSEPARKELAAKLVDRELAVQQALSMKLDRQPEVMRQIEEARRDLLARAYARSLAATSTRPTEQEAAHYYSEHPELYAQRKVFLIKMVSVKAGSSGLDEFKQRVTQGKSMDETITWLGNQKIQFGKQVVIRPAEDIPGVVVKQLAATADNGMVLLESPHGMVAYQVLSAQSSPIAWEAAKPGILVSLAKQGGMRVVESEMRHLRNTAKIEYLSQAAATTGLKKI